MAATPPLNRWIVAARQAGRRAYERSSASSSILVHIGWPGFWEVLDLTHRPGHPIALDQHPVRPRRMKSRTRACSAKRPRPPSSAARPPHAEALARNGGVLGIIWFYQKDLDDVDYGPEPRSTSWVEDHIGSVSDLYGVQLALKSLEDISKVRPSPAIGRAAAIPTR